MAKKCTKLQLKCSLRILELSSVADGFQVGTFEVLQRLQSQSSVMTNLVCVVSTIKLERQNEGVSK